MASEAFKRYVDHTASYNLSIDCAMDGPLTAKIALVGEYPGETEVAMNKPFVGGSGKHLWDSLRQLRILRTDCYATNVVKRRVNAKMPVRNDELSLWKEALIFELSQLPELEVIVCLGNAPMNALLGFDGITQHRGSVYEWESKKVVCAYNPAYVMRIPQHEIVFAMDMHKVADVFRGDYKPHYINKVINPSYAEAMQYISDIRNVYKRCSIDIETIAGETACIGLAHDPHYAMCINLRTQDDHAFSVPEERELLRAINAMLNDPSVWVVAQNGNFDAHWMGFKDHFHFRVDFDTLLAHHTLYPRLPHNLGFLTAQYTTHPYYKDDKANFKEGRDDIDSFWRYNCTDAAITMAIALKQIDELRQQGLYEFFTEHVMAVQPNLVTSTVTGVAVDLSVRERLTNEMNAAVSEAYQRFQAAVQHALNDPYEEVNPNSPKQMCALIFDKLKCTHQRRSTDVHVRDDLLKDPRVHSDVKEILLRLGDYLERHKFLSTYLETQIDPDLRFRCEWKQYGVAKAPGRLSSAQTLWGSGGNMQNLPSSAYPLYIADESCVLIYFDLSQAEARYVGWDAHIPQWIEDFERARMDGKFDAHRSLAATMFNTPYDDVPTVDIWPKTPEDAAKKNIPFDPERAGEFTMRYIAKRCRHGLNYRMHIARLAQTTGLSLGQASRNYYLYHNTNPELQVWWRALEREVRRTRMLTNSYGRRLFITERLDGNDDALESIVAFRPQSTIGDKTQRVWRQCHADDRWDHKRARIAINVHDALYAIATPDYAKTALSLMKKYAEEPIMVTSIITKQTTPLIIPAETKMSVADEYGLHRMSSLQAIEIEAAR